jgi:hypothetical protein
MIDLCDPAAMFNAEVVDHHPVLRILVIEIEIVGGVLLVAFPSIFSSDYFPTSALFSADTLYDQFGL